MLLTSSAQRPELNSADHVKLDHLLVMGGGHDSRTANSGKSTHLGFQCSTTAVKLQKTLSEAEIRGQKNRVYLIGFVVCLIFSMLFNFKFLG